jgi:hypothetical protein
VSEQEYPDIRRIEKKAPHREGKALARQSHPYAPVSSNLLFREQNTPTNTMLKATA